MFADDTSIQCSSLSVAEVEHSLQNDIHENFDELCQLVAAGLLVKALDCGSKDPEFLSHQQQRSSGCT